MKESKIKTIIFDVDGTIMDTLELSTESFRKALFDVLGKRYTDQELDKYFGMVRSMSLPLMGIDQKYYEEIDRVETEYYVSDEKRFKLFNNIEKVLEELKSKNIELGIVTSRNMNEMNNDFMSLPIANHFNIMVTAEDTEKHKPNPDPIEKYIEKANINKDEVIYIGDTIYDCEAAHKAGIKFGLAGWGAIRKDIEADYFFDKPEEVLEII